MVDRLGPTRGALHGRLLGEAAGLGLGEVMGTHYASKALHRVLDNPDLKDASPQERMSALQQELEPHGRQGQRVLQNALKIEQEGVQQKQREAKIAQEEEKVLREQEEASTLNKIRRGEPVSQEEEARLSPTSQRALIKEEKPLFEQESSKIEARRTADIQTDIVKDHNSSLAENTRLNRQQALSDKGDLSTGPMIKTLNVLGIPLAVLNNPDTEEFSKLEADYVRDVSQIFTGQIRVFEIQAYLKTIPSLMNSKDGRDAIIRNRRTLNEMKNIRFDAMKDIIKENGGKRPEQLDLLIEERTRDKQADLSDQFREGITDDVEKYQQTIPMLDKNGVQHNIPITKLKDALNQEFTPQ